jgi:uncharacterized membrane protein
MILDWDRRVSDWTQAGVIDADAADRIRHYEWAAAAAGRSRRSALLAWGVGILLVGSGLLLLVSTSWDQLPPLARLSLVACVVVAFHLAAAAVPRFAGSLHLAGSLALGPCIFIGASLVDLNGHWPSAMLLWAVGVAAAWVVRRDVAQAALFAVLGPAWLLGEWAVLGESYDLRLSMVGQAGALLLALAYFCAPRRGETSPFRRVLGWLGLVGLLPAAMTLGIQAAVHAAPPEWLTKLPPLPPVPASATAAAWAATLCLPLAVAAALVGRRAWIGLAAAAWVVVLAVLPPEGGRMIVYGWLAVGVTAFGAWSIRTDGVNLATAAFALLVLFFYFDNVMGKVGRSASLIGLGALFLAGGWALERVRQRAVERVAGGAR